MSNLSKAKTKQPKKRFKRILDFRRFPQRRNEVTFFIMPAYKEKTKNTWYVSFYFTDWTGTRKRHLRRGFKRQKDALEYEREFLVKQQGSPDMLFSSLYDLYQKDGKARVRETTIPARDPLF